MSCGLKPAETERPSEMLMRLALALVLSVLLADCGRAAPNAEGAMAGTDAHSHRPVTIDRLATRNPSARISVVSDALGADGDFDLRHTAYGENLSLPLRWTPVEGASAYAIVIEDPDAPSPAPFVHWLIWNIPAATASLPEGLPKVGALASPRGALQGTNGDGGVGYFGPRPPAGTGAHHYHIQVFALDGPINEAASVDLPHLQDALQGHVLADGELVGTFAAP